LATGAKAQPVVILHESVVQALLSLHVTALPPPQAPALQVSPVVHALPSLHAEPFATGVKTQAPFMALHASLVQGLLSLHVTPAHAEHPSGSWTMVWNGVFVRPVATMVSMNQPSVFAVRT
jgi:hypothetical protein